MGKISKGRKLRMDENYKPCTANEGDEIYPNGIFRFNISRILELIDEGKLDAEKEQIIPSEWFKTHYRGFVNEDHLPNVDMAKPILQAEIRPGIFNIIDGNHRLEKAYRDGIEYIDSYKLKGKQLVPFFIDKRGYEAFIDYWNSKL